MDWKIDKWRELEVKPFAKGCWTEEGNYELCNATGLEVLFTGYEDIPANWWREYKDSQGRLHYGR